MKMNFKRVSSLAAVAALGITGIGFSGVAGVDVSSFGVPTAHAADGEVEVPAVLVDADRDGTSSIKVIKYKQNSTNGQNEATGLETPAPEGETLDGVTFTLKKVASIGGTDISSLDWSKNESWTTLKGLVNENGQPEGALTYVSDEGTPVETANGGVAHFENLQFGVYEVSETATPAGVTPAATFYLTLPLASKVATNSTWNYDPVLYPKNTVDTIEKEVVDTDARGVGSTLSYKLKTSLSKPGGETTKKYIVKDTLPSKLAYQSVSLAFENNTSITLTAGDDYTVTPNAAVETGGQEVVIEFTEAGREKLTQAYEADETDKVVHTINAKVVAVDGDDNIEAINRAYFIPNDDDKWNSPDPGGDGDQPGIPSNKVKTRFGKLELTKVAQENNETKLAGAKFKIFKSLDDAKALTNPIEFVDRDGNTVSETTTDDQGLAVFEGLRVSDYENDADVEAENFDSYYLVETQAPDGRSPLAEPIKVNIVGDAGEGNVVLADTLQVENAKTNTGLKLAKTGAQGPIIYAGAATLLIGGGLALVISRHRKESK